MSIPDWNKANAEDRMAKRREIDELRAENAALREEIEQHRLGMSHVIFRQRAAEAEARAEAAEAEVARLEAESAGRLRECEQYAAAIKDVFGYDWMDRAVAAEARAEAAEAEVARLRRQQPQDPYL